MTDHFQNCFFYFIHRRKYSTARLKLVRQDFYSRVGFLSGYPIPRKKIPIPKVKDPDEIPNPGDKNPETQKKSRNRNNQKIFEVFQISVENFKT